MATIRRARSYGRYLLALFISGFVSLLGRPSPSWAQAAKAEHNATVFRNTYLVAQTTTKIPTWTGFTSRPSWPSQGMDISKRSPSWPSQGMDIAKQVAPETPFLLNIDPQILTKVEQIQIRIRDGNTTTPGEDALVISVQNAAKLEELSAQMRKIDDLSNQINVLLLKLNSLQEKAHSE